MPMPNKLTRIQKLLLILVTLFGVKLADAAFDATAIHKKGQANQKVDNNLRVTGTFTAQKVCVGGADATNDCLDPGLPQINQDVTPTNGTILAYNGDAGAYDPSAAFGLGNDPAPTNGSIIVWNGDAGVFNNAPASGAGLTLTASQAANDAGFGFVLKNTGDLGTVQHALRVEDSAATLLAVTGAGQVELKSGQKLCLDGATCGADIYSPSAAKVATTGEFQSGATLTAVTNIDGRGYLTNGGASYGGSLAFNDPIRNLSTTEALFESSTSATAGVDTAFKFNSLNSLSSTDYLLYGTNNSAQAFVVYGNGGVYAASDLSTGSGYLKAGGTVGLSLRGAIADGATAVAAKIGNTTALTTAGAKIVSFYSDNLTTEKAYIDKDGHAYFADGVDPAGIHAKNDAGYVWDDLRVALGSVSRSAVKAPTLTEIMDSTGTGGASTGVYGWGFSNAQEDDLVFDVQTPHGYANGMPIEAHIHWTMITTSTASPAVTWGLECSPFADLTGSYAPAEASVQRSHTGTTATIRVANDKYEIGQNIVVAGVSEAGCSAGAYNGNYQISAISATGLDISYTSGAVTCEEAATGDVGGTVTGYTITKTVQANVATNSQWKNLISEFGTFRMKLCTGLSCVASCRVYRPNLADLNEFIVARSIDFHVPLNKIGSRSEQSDP